MLNKVILMGRLTRDPELRQTNSGLSVASFTLAVDRDFSDDSGKRPTDFIDCVAWRQSADFAAKYFHKGELACVVGRMQAREWTDKDGAKRRSWEVLIEHMYFAQSKAQAAAPAQAQPRYQPTEQPHYMSAAELAERYPDTVQTTGGAYAGYRGSFDELEEDDGDLPF